MFKRNYSFLYHCLLFCRYVMFQKRNLSKPKSGHKQPLWGARPSLAPHSDGTTISSTALIRVLEASELKEMQITPKILTN